MTVFYLLSIERVRWPLQIFGNDPYDQPRADVGNDVIILLGGGSRAESVPPDFDVLEPVRSAVRREAAPYGYACKGKDLPISYEAGPFLRATPMNPKSESGLLLLSLGVPGK